MFSALLGRRSSKEALPYNALSPTWSDEGSDNAVPAHRPSNRLGIFAIVLCTCLTIVNIVVASRSRTHVAPHLIRSYRDVDIQSLRRPSQFIGLDTVARPSPPIPRNITIYPTVLAQIDEQNPDMVFDDDPKHYTRRVGTISLEDRRVQITDSVRLCSFCGEGYPPNYRTGFNYRPIQSNRLWDGAMRAAAEDCPSSFVQRLSPRVRSYGASYCQRV